MRGTEHMAMETMDTRESIRMRVLRLQRYRGIQGGSVAVHGLEAEDEIAGKRHRFRCQL